MQQAEKQTGKLSLKNLAKRFGVAGFLFFFFKGLILYILLPAFLIWFGYTW